MDIIQNRLLAIYLILKELIHSLGLVCPSSLAVTAALKAGLD